MAIYQRGKSWWLKLHIPKDAQAPSGGTMHRESLKTRDRAMAEAKAKVREGELRAGWAILASPSATAVKEYQKAVHDAQECGGYRLAAELSEKIGALTARMAALECLIFTRL